MFVGWTCVDRLFASFVRDKREAYYLKNIYIYIRRSQVHVYETHKVGMQRPT